jgi:hypothetical protein
MEGQLNRLQARISELPENACSQAQEKVDSMRETLGILADMDDIRQRIHPRVKPVALFASHQIESGGCRY